MQEWDEVLSLTSINSSPWLAPQPHIPYGPDLPNPHEQHLRRDSWAIGRRRKRGWKSTTMPQHGPKYYCIILKKSMQNSKLTLTQGTGTYKTNKCMKSSEFWEKRLLGVTPRELRVTLRDFLLKPVGLHSGFIVYADFRGSKCQKLVWIQL